MKKTILFVIIVAGIIVLAVWYNGQVEKRVREEAMRNQENIAQEKIQLMAKLQVKDITVGTGDVAQDGDTVTVNYVGRLANGTKFDSSYDRGQPFTFTLGQADVIKGWDLGVLGMRVGGRRQLTIPPELGYGSEGAGSLILPNATLVFTIELISATSSKPAQG